MSCLEPSDLLNFKYRCQDVPLCCDEEQIQEALDAAQELVEAYTGQKFCPEETCKYFDGTGKSILFLTEGTNLPLTEIDSFEISGVSVDVDDLHLEDHTIRYKDGKCFPCGSRNIKVCGTFGKPLPSAVKTVILTIAMEALAPGSAGLQNPGVQQAVWADFSIRYQIDKTFLTLRKTTGFNELDRVLESYMNPMTQVMFGVVSDCPNKCKGDCEKSC